MKNTDDPGGGDAKNANICVPVDPTSISLFSDEIPQRQPAPLLRPLPSPTPVHPVVGNGVAASAINRQASFASGQSTSRDVPLAHKVSGSAATTIATKEPMQKAGERRKHASYSTYIQGKATEVAKRRRLNERVEKMKNSRGLIFNVPQCKEITTNQLAIFLRRLRKSQDVRLIMSSQLMSTIFQDEQLPKPDQADIDRRLANLKTSLYNEDHSSIYGSSRSSSKHQAVISVNDILGEKEDTVRPSTSASGLSHHHQYVNGVDDGDATESSSNSEWEDEVEEDCAEKVFTNGIGDTMKAKLQRQRDKKMSVEDFQFYKARMEILSADLRAITYYRHYTELQEEARKIQLQDNFQFELIPNTDDEKADLQTCARCRPLINRPQRQVISHTHLERRNRPATSIKTNMRCGVAEYAAVDDSIHPLLSLESAIPMERKLQKYMHVSSLIAPEVERRRQKIAELALKKSRSSMTSLFYSTEEIQIPDEEDSKSSTSVPLTLKKRLPREPEASMEVVNHMPVTVISAPPASSTSRQRGGAVRHKSRRASACVNDEEIIRDNDDQFDDENDSSVTYDEAEDDEYYRPRTLSRRRQTHGGQSSKRSTLKVTKKVSFAPLPSSEEVPKKLRISANTISSEKPIFQSKSKNNNYIVSMAASAYKMEKNKASTLSMKGKFNGKPRGSENRRSSMHNIGRDESVFDFDSTFTDIGLTAVQNVETKEILIPQFSRKNVLDSSVKKPCDCCSFFTHSDPFEKIRQMHEVLETQERMRFKSVTAVRSRTTQAH